MSEQLPQPDLDRIRSTTPRTKDLKVMKAGTRVTRIHALGGAHPIPWNEFRAWGPTKSRFDHQPPPPKSHPSRRVLYVAHTRTAFTAALAEYFQDDGGGILPLDLTRNRPTMTIFELERDLELLDLSSGWITRAGGNQAIASGKRSASRAWARSIYKTHPTIQGLIYPSSVWGPGRCAVLWERAQRCMPSNALASRPLDDPYLRRPIAQAAHDLNTFTV
jgi:RES domain